MWSDWLFVYDCGFSLSAFWCPLSAPAILVGFLLPWMWGITLWLLQQSAATAAYIQFSSVQSLSPVRLFATPWIACTPGLPVHHHLPEFTQIHVHRVSDAIQPSHPLSSPSPALNFSFQMNQLFASGGQSTGVSASASVLPMNVQDWFPLGLTGWISLQSNRLSRVFSNTTVQNHQFFGSQFSS